ncbi:MAG: hypothetical protein RMM29_01965 [Planctomycetota bacterium]|nr:hypothetical protein [Planctomycetota bacterium]MCX8040302.1 hypothetical protein [Planctomycetota bacterium]MDW8372403.1 hypothetical protein [Planctomycetota bacterium]
MAESEVTLVFAALDEPWQGLLLVAGALAAALAAWRWYGPAPPGAWGAAARGCRALACALLVLLLGQPSAQWTTIASSPGGVLLAIDTSASMGRADATGGATRIAIAEQLRQQLLAEAEARRMRLAVHALDAAGSPLSEPPRAHEPSSPLGDAVVALVEQRRPEVLIIASDGRVTSGSSLAAAGERLRGRELRVFALALGSQRLDPELFIDEVLVNREAALDELEPVTVRLSARALPPEPLVVELAVDDETVDRVALEPPAEREQLQALTARLAATLRRRGPAQLAVRARCGQLERQQRLQVTVSERRLTALLLEREPRYELRYLREALKRDSGATVHAYLADPRWRRWGGEGPERLPLTAGELAPYDAIILGDLGAEAFRSSDLAALAAHVRTTGAGLILIPGESGAAASLAHSPLAELLPAELGDSAQLARGYREQRPRRLQRTALAASLGVLDSGGQPWEQLAPLLGAAALQPRPGSEVLATDQDGAALVVARSAGAGRVVLIGVDDCWRWRRGVGDRYLHRFHSQLLRFAAAARRPGSEPWRITVSPRRAAVGEPVVVDVQPAPGLELEAPEELTLRLSGPDDASLVVPAQRRGRGYSARLAAPAPGTWKISPASGLPSARVESGELTVLASDDERRDPRADPEALRAFAAALGGQVFTDPAALLAALPRDLAQSSAVVSQQGLWDTAWAFLLLLALLAAEWTIRRRQRLP